MKQNDIKNISQTSNHISTTTAISTTKEQRTIKVGKRNGIERGKKKTKQN